MGPSIVHRVPLVDNADCQKPPQSGGNSEPTGGGVDFRCALLRMRAIAFELLGVERAFWGGVATLVLKPRQKPYHGDAQLKREKSRDD